MLFFVLHLAMACYSMMSPLAGYPASGQWLPHSHWKGHRATGCRTLLHDTTHIYIILCKTNHIQHISSLLAGQQQRTDQAVGRT